MTECDRWKRVNDALTEFRRDLAPSFPPLTIESLYDYSWSDEQYRQSRSDGRYWKWGVYIFFDGPGDVLYVGQATYSFDKRVWTHERREATCIDVISFPETVWHFIPALELFLICKLKPKHNKVAMTYKVGSDVDCDLGISPITNL
jgi:hypothetical protein